MFYLHRALGPGSHPGGQESAAFWWMPADSWVEVDIDGDRVSVNQVFRVPSRTARCLPGPGSYGTKPGSFLLGLGADPCSFFKGAVTASLESHGLWNLKPTWPPLYHVALDKFSSFLMLISISASGNHISIHLTEAQDNRFWALTKGQDGILSVWYVFWLNPHSKLITWIYDLST